MRFHSQLKYRNTNVLTHEQDPSRELPSRRGNLPSRAVPISWSSIALIWSWADILVCFFMHFQSILCSCLYVGFRNTRWNPNMEKWRKWRRYSESFGEFRLSIRMKPDAWFPACWCHLTCPRTYISISSFVLSLYTTNQVSLRHKTWSKWLTNFRPPVTTNKSTGLAGLEPSDYT